ncbi:sensor domain-containing diguanylate cyclase [Ferrimonas senticii]|uniref:sensor domain-containing diguanylate cyclase n=1 Tax=Ferrimonas senticii TaxID=394566 RepID=UPI000484D906|nr:diguanylate cyclase [Ferrimonas senticii]
MTDPRSGALAASLVKSPISILLAVLLGGAAALINAWPLPLFASAQLMLGAALVMLAVSRLGLVEALLSAAVAGSVIAWQWQHPLPLLLLMLEAAVVWGLCHRGVLLLYADAAFWLLLGMPLLYVAVMVIAPDDPSLTFVVLKQGFNGLINAAIASLLLLMLPSRWWRRVCTQPLFKRGFREKISYVTVLLLMLISMSTMLIYSSYLINSQQQLLLTQLQQDGNRIADNAHRFLGRYLSLTRSAGQWLPNDLAAQQQQLQQLHQQLPQWLTMLVADRTGNVIATSPLRPELLGVSVAQRDYFIEVLAGADQYVSGAFQGQGFGDEIIVAISAPWFDEFGQVAGIIEGSVDLQGMVEVLDPAPDQFYLITDGQQRVVVASEQLGLKPLTPISAGQGQLLHPDSLVQRRQLTAPFALAEEVYQIDYPLGHGWTLQLMQPLQPIMAQAQQQFIIGLGILALGLLVAVAVTRRLCGLLTSPLEQLARQMALPYHPEQSQRPLNSYAAKELQLLQSELTSQRRNLYAYQQQLEQQVAARTKELSEANAQLKKLAMRDGLTEAFNRRYFDISFESYRQHSMRSGQPLLLAMVDIDHFKSVNDCFGHLVGDDCLRTLVQRMNQLFSRENDLVARYGGEEFVLLVPYVGFEAAQQMLERLRLLVAEKPIAVSEQGQPISITISIGAVYADARFSKRQARWLQRADKALYEAKQAGRNRVRLYNLANHDNDVGSHMDSQAQLHSS